MTLAERVILAIKHSRKSQREIAGEIGISPGALTLWKTGETKDIKSTHLHKAAKALGVHPEWLATGKGEMLAPNLGAAIQTPWRPVVVINSDEDIEHDVIAIPRYTVKASAGNGEPVLEIDTKGQPNYCRGGWAKRNGYKAEDLFSIVANGDSMEPTIPNGASLIVHKQNEIVSGKVHVICKGNECYVKRLILQMDGSLLARSDNRENYKDMELRPEDPETLHIVGQVVSVSFNL
ncbi:XRE family transcriptional regulator [Craterilacuibacter sinensis]|nr:S24 family peptidase [Craterilacuibacter sinensis]